jgi:hypothetical protein
LLACALLIEAEQARQDFIVREQPGAPVVAPAVSLGHGFIERGMGVCQPLRARVVEVGEGALLDLLRRLLVPGQDAIGIAGYDLRLADDEIGRVQPGLAQFVEPRRRRRDGLRARVSRVVGSGDVGGQAFGETNP